MREVRRHPEHRGVPLAIPHLPSETSFRTHLVPTADRAKPRLEPIFRVNLVGFVVTPSTEGSRSPSRTRKKHFEGTKSVKMAEAAKIRKHPAAKIRKMAKKTRDTSLQIRQPILGYY